MQRKKTERGISEAVLCAEYEAVYRYVYSLCRNPADAQEITQETFLRAMKTAGSFQGNSSLYTWLCAIGKNLWFERYRKQGRELLGEEEIWEHTGKRNSTSAEQQVVEQELLMEIHHVLHRMKEPYKEVFSLRIFGQLSFREIGELFEKTESWARVTYHRAKRIMTETLRKDGIV